MKESMRSLDIIFLCRFDANQKVEDDGFRETDVKFILEVDNILFKTQSLYGALTNIYIIILNVSDNVVICLSC